MSSLSRARASRLPALRQCCYYSFNALLNLNYLSTTTTTNSTTATTRISTSTSTSAAPSRPLLSSVVTGRRRRESGESSIKSSSEIVFRTFASSAATSSSTPRSDVLLRNQKLPSSSLLGQVRWHQHHDDDPDAEKILVVFVDKDGDEYEIQAPVGKNLLEIAHMNDIELEGACEGSLACSTCHVIIEDEDQYDMLDEPDEDEEDMLDLAFGLTETSRLGCQVICKPELDGLRVKIPNATRNMAVDGFVPKPH